MMRRSVPLYIVNTIASNKVTYAKSIKTLFNPNGYTATNVVIEIAADAEKTYTHVSSIPVYLPASVNYRSYKYYELYDLLKRGNPQVAVEFENLSIQISRKRIFYGLAQSFSVVGNVERRLKEESFHVKKTK